MILAPLVSQGYHPASLKVSNGILLDRPGKPSYESPASIRIIVLIRTVWKILERIERPASSWPPGQRAC